MPSEIHHQLKAIIPPLLPKFHKGQLGRILVVGGSEDYTGAPYFAAMASAMVGADMSHILCTSSAGPIIKTYSPNLMVHPYIHDEGVEEPLSSKIDSLLDRMHVVLVGPGLGRDQHVLGQVEQILALCRKRNLPLVIDADGLFLVQQKPEVIKQYLPNRTVLTPNVVEFQRLVKSCLLLPSSRESQARQLAKIFKCTVLVKGETDLITNGEQLVECRETGSNRRVSGQGDTLSGSLTTFMAWTEAYNAKLWDVEPVSTDLHVLACFGASTVCRKASKLAYAKAGRAMGTTDVQSCVGEAFKEMEVGLDS